MCGDDVIFQISRYIEPLVAYRATKVVLLRFHLFYGDTRHLLFVVHFQVNGERVLLLEVTRAILTLVLGHVVLVVELPDVDDEYIRPIKTFIAIFARERFRAVFPAMSTGVLLPLQSRVKSNITYLTTIWIGGVRVPVYVHDVHFQSCGRRECERTRLAIHPNRRRLVVSVLHVKMIFFKLLLRFDSAFMPPLVRTQSTGTVEALPAQIADMFLWRVIGGTFCRFVFEAHVFSKLVRIDERNFTHLTINVTFILGESVLLLVPNQTHFGHKSTSTYVALKNLWFHILHVFVLILRYIFLHILLQMFLFVLLQLVKSLACLMARITPEHLPLTGFCQVASGRWNVIYTVRLHVGFQIKLVGEYLETSLTRVVRIVFIFVSFGLGVGRMWTIFRRLLIHYSFVHLLVYLICSVCL